MVARQHSTFPPPVYHIWVQKPNDKNQAALVHSIHRVTKLAQPVLCSQLHN